MNKGDQMNKPHPDVPLQQLASKCFAGSCASASRTVLAVTLVAMLATAPGEAKTAYEHLQALPKPAFKAGHRLILLTRSGWELSYELNVEFAANWGYTLEFSGHSLQAVHRGADLADTNAVPSRLLALAARDPETYRLGVTGWPPNVHHGMHRRNLPEEGFLRQADGAVIEGGGNPVFSPEAPDDVMRQVAADWVEILLRIRSRAPIAVILNMGEYGLGVAGHIEPYLVQDPAVVKARGERSWFDYLSDRKAHQEMIISRAVRKALPGLRWYTFYATLNSHRNRIGHWRTWAYAYPAMRPVADIPSSQYYFRQYNSGWTGKDDMLTLAMNAFGEAFSYGDRHTYDFLCAGWPRQGWPEADALGDIARYTGFLKCLYTAGMVGAHAGYFNNPPCWFGKRPHDYGDEAPHWLLQMAALGHIQALFSHHEESLWEGYLLPGPLQHRWSTDQPGYEFPTGDADARVLARKRYTEPVWLLTAWAAGGPDREVTVEIPELGTVRLLARDRGSVYRATVRDGKPSLEQLDADGLYPTASMRRAP